jgi:hypothetical protein
VTVFPLAPYVLAAINVRTKAVNGKIQKFGAIARYKKRAEKYFSMKLP